MSDKKETKEDLLCVPFKEIEWKSSQVIDLFDQIKGRLDEKKVSYSCVDIFSNSHLDLNQAQDLHNKFIDFTDDKDFDPVHVYYDNKLPYLFVDSYGLYYEDGNWKDKFDKKKRTRVFSLVERSDHGPTLIDFFSDLSIRNWFSIRDGNDFCDVITIIAKTRNFPSGTQLQSISGKEFGEEIFIPFFQSKESIIERKLGKDKNNWNVPYISKINDDPISGDCYDLGSKKLCWVRLEAVACLLVRILLKEEFLNNWHSPKAGISENSSEKLSNLFEYIGDYLDVCKFDFDVSIAETLDALTLAMSQQSYQPTIEAIANNNKRDPYTILKIVQLTKILEKLDYSFDQESGEVQDDFHSFNIYKDKVIDCIPKIFEKLKRVDPELQLTFKPEDESGESDFEHEGEKLSVNQLKLLLYEANMEWIEEGPDSFFLKGDYRSPDIFRGHISNEFSFLPLLFRVKSPKVYPPYFDKSFNPQFNKQFDLTTKIVMAKMPGEYGGEWPNLVGSWDFENNNMLSCFWNSFQKDSDFKIPNLQEQQKIVLEQRLVKTDVKQYASALINNDFRASEGYLAMNPNELLNRLKFRERSIIKILGTSAHSEGDLIKTFDPLPVFFEHSLEYADLSHEKTLWGNLVKCFQDQLKMSCLFGLEEIDIRRNRINDFEPPSSQLLEKISGKPALGDWAQLIDYLSQYSKELLIWGEWIEVFKEHKPSIDELIKDRNIIAHFKGVTHLQYSTIQESESKIKSFLNKLVPKLRKISNELELVIPISRKAIKGDLDNKPSFEFECFDLKSSNNLPFRRNVILDNEESSNLQEEHVICFKDGHYMRAESFFIVDLSEPDKPEILIFEGDYNERESECYFSRLYNGGVTKKRTSQGMFIFG